MESELRGSFPSKPRHKGSKYTRGSVYSRKSSIFAPDISKRLKHNSVIKIQRFLKTALFKRKISKSKIRILALYKGWKVRRLLQENEVLTALMNIQDVNAYIEELEFSGDTEILYKIKIRRIKLVSEFITLLDSYLGPTIIDHEPKTRRASIDHWARSFNKIVSCSLSKYRFQNKLEILS